MVQQLAAPQALIFDMDGLMVDSEPLWWKVEHALAADHGCRWTDELARSCLGTGLETAAEVMRREIGLPLSVEEAVAGLLSRFTARVDELQLKPGCRQLLDAAAAADLKLAVASSSALELIEAVMDRFALKPRFDVLVSGQSVPNPKPAPDVFLATAELLGVAIDRCVVLEDSKAGTQAGAASGATVFAVPEHDADDFYAWTPHVLEDLHQALALLQL